METMIKDWKEAGIGYAKFIFSCGGDSMNDCHFEYFTEDHDEIPSFEHETELEDILFKRVEFYVNSDGHYMGEDGTVTIELNEEEDDFYFSKEAEAEYCERITSEVAAVLTDEEVDYINKYAEDIIGGEDDNTDINYKINFIKTYELDEIEKSIFEKIDDVAGSFSPAVDGEVRDFYSFSLTNDQTEDIKIDGNELTIYVDNEYYTYITENN